MPDGRLCTPCDVSGQHAVNVLDHRSLKTAVKASRPHLGAYPCREGHCFKAGILERSRLFGLLSPDAPQ
jgi:tetrahydromethanopterin S-methyltransferase subunit B